MQKVQIVNFIIFCLFCIGAYSQQSKLSGKFCETDMPVDTGRCYDFSEDGTFSFISGGDLPPNIYGEGTYTIVNKFLILKYRNNDTYKLSYHKLEKQLSLSDSIQIDFKVRNFEGEPIIGTNVLFKNNSGFTTNGIRLDENGNGHLKFKKMSDILKMEFSRVGYQNNLIEIQKDYSYIIKVFLAKYDQNLPIADYIDTLKVINLNKNRLELKDKSGRVTNWLKK